MKLADVCPRLARARDQYLAERAARAARLRRLAREQHRTERLLAHRELQLIRAGATNDGRYVKRRADKLAQTQQRLADLRAAIDQELEAA